MAAMEGPCEELVAVERDPGCYALRPCGRPGIERPDMRPQAAVSDIACDACYTAWKAAEDARHPR